MKAKIIAIEEFLKGHTEQAKVVIKSNQRSAKLHAHKEPVIHFKLYSSYCPMNIAYFDGNKNGYRTVQGGKDDLFTLRTFYVGKKGDVIFVFDSPRFSNSTADRVELKLEQAFESLPTFVGFIYDLFEDLIKERVGLHLKAENEKELSELVKKRLEIDALKEAKAAKYAGKLSYGAW